MIFGAVLGLTFLTNLSYFVFLLIACAVVAAWRWRETFRRDRPRFAQAAATAALVGAPLLIPMARELVVFHSLDLLGNWANANDYSADLYSWVTPVGASALWGSAFDATSTPAGRAGSGLPSRASRSWPWPCSAARGGGGASGCGSPSGMPTFVVLSFGPYLHVGGQQGGRFVRYGIRYTYWMPYQLLARSPGVERRAGPGPLLGGRHPRPRRVGGGRVGVAHGPASRNGAPSGAWSSPAVALVLVVVEFFPRSIVTQKPGIPRPYAAIAADPGRRAVLEIPLQWRTGFGDFGDVEADHSIFLYYATRHGKPLAGGVAARYPARGRRALFAPPGLFAGRRPPAGRPGLDHVRRRRTAPVRIGYVVYHRDRPRPAAEVYLGELRMPVLADDGTVLVWKVP